tara:strand:+ start:430 stop:900 length:471 start_codon:yes stop_codon:yes gene_type:complete
MTREILEAVQLRAEQKKKYLQSKITDSQKVPKWLLNEFDFVNDQIALATALFESKRSEKKKEEQIVRLTDLAGLFESAFNQLLKNRPSLVHFTGRIEPLQVGTIIFFQLARLMPEGINKQETLQFYVEYTSELLTGIRTEKGGSTKPFTIISRAEN